MLLEHIAKKTDDAVSLMYTDTRHTLKKFSKCYLNIMYYAHA